MLFVRNPSPVFSLFFLSKSLPGLPRVTYNSLSLSLSHSLTGDCHFYISKEKVYSGAWMGVSFQTNSRYLAKANAM